MTMGKCQFANTDPKGAAICSPTEESSVLDALFEAYSGTAD